MVSRDYLARWWGALGVTSFGIFCALLGAAVALAAPTPSVILVTSIAACVVGPIVLRIVQRRFDPFEPIVAFSLAWGVMFVLRPVAMIANDDFSFAYSPSLDLHQTFDKMLILALLGALAFVVGYHSSFGAKVARLAPAPPSKYQPSLVVLGATGVALLALLGMALLINQLGGFSQLSATSAEGRSVYLNLLNRSNVFVAFAPVLLVGATLVIFAIGVEQRSRPFLLFAFLFGVLAWVIFTQGGSRGVLTPLLVAPVIFYYLARSRRPRALTLIVGISVALFLSTLIGERRQPLSPAGQDWKGAASYVAMHPSTITDGLTRGQDNGMAPALVAALQITPREIPHTYGSAFLRDLATRTVPRDIWPAKPLPPREKLIAKFDIAGHENLNVNPEFSNLLVLYMDWGMFGALMLALYGVAARGLYEWLKIYSRSTPARLMFALFLTLLLSAFRDSSVDFLINVLFMIGPVWLVFALGHARGGSQAMRHEGSRLGEIT